MKFRPSERYEFTYDPEWVITPQSLAEAEERLRKAREKEAKFILPSPPLNAEAEDTQPNEQSICQHCGKPVNAVARMFDIKADDNSYCQCPYVDA